MSEAFDESLEKDDNLSVSETINARLSLASEGISSNNVSDSVR